MASNAGAAGNSLKKKKPQCGNTEASGNEINFEEEIVMGDNSTNVIPFNFGKQQVRTLLIGGEPWFVATDISAALQYRDSFNMCRNLDDDEKGTQIVSTLGGAQEMLAINESGLYGAILRSRKQEAKLFKKWVTGEVLPAIRKTGRYDDQQGRLVTLIGQTIGTDGFHCLGAVLDGKVRQLPAKARQRAKMHIWSQVHKAFSVVSAQDIPAEQFDSARNFIAAYALEGEYIEALPKHGVALDQYETHHLYLLMSRFAAMFKHKNDMLAASRALGSTPLMGIFEQLKEGDRSFEVLDRRRAEIYGAYSATGCQGGYAWRAVA